MTAKNRVQFVLIFLFCITLYSLGVFSYAHWNYNGQRESIIREIDNRLLMAAKSLRFILERDFHDRAVNASSISFSEELRNRRNISSFAMETGFTYVYTLVEKDGRFYFSAPTVTEKEALERKSWYFYPYDDIPETFRKALYGEKPVFLNYTDQWGHFRSVALPQVSPGGRPYLSCADMDISSIEQLYRRSLLESIFTSIFFMAGSIPFIIFFRMFYKSYTTRLKTINRELLEHKNNLEKLVEQRTKVLQGVNDRLTVELHEREAIEKELKEEKSKLEEALASIKTLSGLIPICSSCKKIRDDKGYWNQIEIYIKEHSDARFTHGICPECAKKLYPGFDLESDENQSA